MSRFPIWDLHSNLTETSLNQHCSRSVTLHLTQKWFTHSMSGEIDCSEHHRTR